MKDENKRLILEIFGIILLNVLLAILNIGNTVERLIIVLLALIYWRL